MILQEEFFQFSVGNVFSFSLTALHLVLRNERSSVCQRHHVFTPRASGGGRAVGLERKPLGEPELLVCELSGALPCIHFTF